MQTNLSGAIMRLHSPFNLRAVDRALLLCGYGFCVLGLGLMLGYHWRPGVTGVLGGLLVIHQARACRDKRMAAVWDHAAAGLDPVETLALFEYLYSLPFRDLRVVADWRAACDASGVPVGPTDDDPPQVRAVWEHVRRVPRE